VKIAILHQGYRVLVFFVNSSFQKVTFANRSPEVVWVSVEYSRSCCCDGSVPQSIKKCQLNNDRKLCSVLLLETICDEKTRFESSDVPSRSGLVHGTKKAIYLRQCSAAAVRVCVKIVGVELNGALEIGEKLR
jgi:hypothetical protein